MDLSGVIFVVLALAWAVYLIPKTLKQHDEVARSRSIDRFSGAMRVLAHREPGEDRNARLVVRPSVPPAAPASPPAATPTATATAAPTAAPTAAMPTPAGEPAPVVTSRADPAPVAVSVTVEPATSRASVAARRTAARVAARRRRRVLTLLLVCDLALGLMSYLGVVPRMSVLAPAVVTLVWLVLCRSQVRGETRRDAPVLTSRPASRPADGRDRDVVEEVVLVEDVVTPAEGVEDTVGLSVAALQEALVTRAAEQVAGHLPGTAADQPLEVHVEAADMLWDPLPVTLPTYVTKDKARRTVRTIDLGEPGTWTSGRTVEDAEIAARATEQASVDDHGVRDGQRVVGG